MESVDGWHLATISPRFLEEAALWDPPFAGVSMGSGPSTRGPYAAASPRP